MIEPRREAAGVALVTGGCSGIGLALAGRLAARGHALVLVSERAAALTTAARGLEARYGVAVQTIVIDLARAEAAEELHAEVRARGLEVEVLINNAGFLLFGEAVDVDPARANALLQLHVVTPSLLCTRFGREMRARGRGHIMLVASISAWRDFPGISYYGSSKKYLRGFARALRCELGVHGVNVTCLAPGATATGLYDGMSATVARARRFGVMMEAEAVAESGLAAMFAGEAEHVPGLLTRAMTVGAVLTPQWVIDALRRRAPWLRGGAK